MAKPKYDGVIEAVRYTSEGQIVWVRGYLRTGPIFGDWVLIERQQLIELLKAGKTLYAGRRIEQMASTFEVTQSLRLEQKDGRDIVVLGNGHTGQDRLEGVAVI
jgi:hypothetical protein